MPFIHPKLSYSNFHVQAVVVLDVNAAVAQTFSNHELMSSFAALNLRNQASSCLSKVPHKSFVPEMLVLVAPRWSFASSNAYNNSHLSTRPLIHASFIEGNWGRVVLPRPLIDK
jgi:hypothetical protein